MPLGCVRTKNVDLGSRYSYQIYSVGEPFVQLSIAVFAISVSQMRTLLHNVDFEMYA